MDDFAFSADEERLLVGLLDAIVPASADGRLPGAGQLDLVEHIARTVRETPMLRPVVEYGMSALSELAAKRADGDVHAVLEEFAAGDQFFMPAFLFLVYSTYYQNPRVLAALGLEARPPHPKGHEMEPIDLTLLDPVRRRDGMFRKS
jgi:hypothetical protein